MRAGDVATETWMNQRPMRFPVDRKLRTTWLQTELAECCPRRSVYPKIGLMIAPGKPKEHHHSSVRHVDASEPGVPGGPVHSNTSEAQWPIEYLCRGHGGSSRSRGERVGRLLKLQNRPFEGELDLVRKRPQLNVGSAPKGDGLHDLLPCPRLKLPSYRAQADKFALPASEEGQVGPRNVDFQPIEISLGQFR